MISKYLNLKVIQKFFLSAGVLVVFFIPFDYWINMGIEIPKTSNESEISVREEQIKVENFEAYAAIFKTSALFGSLGSSVSSMATLSIQEMSKDYRLKGVILANDPEAIIEDARTQKTTFVHKGQMLGELQVSDIREGSVVLNYSGEQVNLKIQ